MRGIAVWQCLCFSHACDRWGWLRWSIRTVTGDESSYAWPIILLTEYGMVSYTSELLWDPEQKEYGDPCVTSGFIPN